MHLNVNDDFGYAVLLVAGAILFAQVYFRIAPGLLRLPLPYRVTWFAVTTMVTGIVGYLVFDLTLTKPFQNPEEALVESKQLDATFAMFVLAVAGLYILVGDKLLAAMMGESEAAGTLAPPPADDPDDDDDDVLF